MPRQTRKARLKQKAAAGGDQVVKPASRQSGGTYRQVVCPVCGTSHGSRYFWERTREFDPDKPFGVIQETYGRGSFQVVGQLEPEDEPEIFDALKARLGAAVREWIAKGWLSREELEL